MPASKAASKIGSLKSGSTEFMIASAPVSRMSDDDRFAVGRIDLVCAEAVVSQAGDDLLRSRGVVVRERAVLEERAALRDAGKRGADATGTDDEDSHGGVLPDLSLVGASCERAAVDVRRHRSGHGRPSSRNMSVEGMSVEALGVETMSIVRTSVTKCRWLRVLGTCPSRTSSCAQSSRATDLHPTSLF